MKKSIYQVLATSLLVFCLGSPVSSPANAEQIQIEVEIPEIDTSQYRRPYVAMWIEEKGNWKSNQTFALWFDDHQWLKDIRRWWRKVGRYNKDIDGFSGATKAAGSYSVKRSVKLEDQTKYVLYIEAVREHGNRTLLKIPISKADIGNDIAADVGKEIGLLKVQINAN